MLKAGYYITLLGEDKDIDQCKLVANSVAEIIKYDGLWYLSNDKIRKSENQNDALKNGMDLLDSIRGLWTLYEGGHLAVIANGVVTIKGTDDNSQICKDIDFQFEVTKELSETEKTTMKEILCLAVNNPCIQEVLFYLRNGVPNNYDGHKITEIIEDEFKEANCDMNNKIDEKSSAHSIFGGNKIWNNLRMNYNCKELQGTDARHARENNNSQFHEAMSKEELWGALQNGIKNWLEHKRNDNTNGS